MKAPKWLQKKELEMPPELSITEPKPVQIKSKNVKRYSLEQMLEEDVAFAKKAFTRNLLKGASADNIRSGFNDCSFFLVESGKKAELELVCDNSVSLNFIFIGERASLRLCTKVVSDSDDSRLDCAFLKHKGAFAYHGQAAEAGTGAILNSSAFWGGSGRGETVTDLKGANSRALHIGLSGTGDSEGLSLDSRVLHSANSTKSEVVMRGVAEDSSSTVFRGNVGVESNGRGSVSSLEQQVLLLDRDAKAETDPVLEIKNNDVQCSHSAAVRQLDEEKVFYLMSRGMDRDKAKNMMVMGFLRSAMSRIKDKELRNVFMPPFMRD
jgi:hypothetical protein